MEYFFEAAAVLALTVLPGLYFVFKKEGDYFQRMAGDLDHYLPLVNFRDIATIAFLIYIFANVKDGFEKAGFIGEPLYGMKLGVFIIAVVLAVNYLIYRAVMREGGISNGRDRLVWSV